MSAGLSLIFGVMNILNFAHATFWLIGGYITYSIFEAMGGEGIPLLIIAIFLGSAIMAAFGFVIERVLISRMYDRDVPEQ